MLARHVRLLAIAITLGAVAGACSSGDSEPAESGSTDSGVRLVTPEDGAAIQENPPAELVILDVRTPEEFAEGHIEGAVMIDFYREDFADQLAGLDPDVPYLVYCRSGNRSGQTAAILEELGFSDVADVDGGINAWTGLGLPTVTP